MIFSKIEEGEKHREAGPGFLFLITFFALGACSTTTSLPPVSSPTLPSVKSAPVELISRTVVLDKPEPLLLPAVPKEGVTIRNKRLEEISGMVSSSRRADVLWVVNDDEPDEKGRLYAIGRDGSSIASFQIQGAKNYDWEDVSRTRWKGRSYLIVADIGDNRASRNYCRLYFVAEPLVYPQMTTSSSVLALPVERSVIYRYENGPRDCEAMACELSGEWAYFVSKRKSQPEVYRLPLSTVTRDGSAELVGHLKPPVLGKEGMDDFSSLMRGIALGNQVTAMDVSPDGRRAALLTYSRILLYEKKGRPWIEVLQDTPKVMGYPPLYQAEALCFSSDSKGLYVCSEGQNSPLYYLPIP